MTQMFSIHWHSMSGKNNNQSEREKASKREKERAREKRPIGICPSHETGWKKKKIPKNSCRAGECLPKKAIFIHSRRSWEKTQIQMNFQSCWFCVCVVCVLLSLLATLLNINNFACFDVPSTHTHMHRHKNRNECWRNTVYCWEKRKKNKIYDYILGNPRYLQMHSPSWWMSHSTNHKLENEKQHHLLVLLLLLLLNSLIRFFTVYCRIFALVIRVSGFCLSLMAFNVLHSNGQFKIWRKLCVALIFIDITRIAYTLDCIGEEHHHWAEFRDEHHWAGRCIPNNCRTCLITLQMIQYHQMVQCKLYHSIYFHFFAITLTMYEWY